MRSQLEMPLGASSAVRLARQHLESRPGSILVDEKDWTAALVLATNPSTRSSDHPIDVAAKTAIFVAGIGVPVFTDDRKKELLRHGAALFGGGGTPSEAIRGRISSFMKVAQDKKKDLEERARLVEQIIEPLLPSGLRMLPHQLEALVMIQDRGFRCVIHDDLGLGKTVEALCSVLLFSAERGGKDAAFPLLIATQASVVGSWIHHSHQWLAKYKVSVGRHPEDKPDVCVMSYAKLLEKWRDIRQWAPKSVIFDESHYLKNPESQRSMAAVLAISTADLALCSTATIEPNGRPEEAFLQLKLCDRSLDWRDYRRKFCGAKKVQIGQKTFWKTDGMTEPVAFGQLLHQMTFRRLKVDLGAALGLSALPRYVLPVEPSVELMMATKEAKEQIRDRLIEKAKERLTVSEEDIERAIQTADLAALTIERMLVEKHKIGTAVERVKDLVADGHRVLCFSYFREAALELHRKLRKGLPRLPIDEVTLGSSDMNPEQRSNFVADAQKKGKVAVVSYAFCEGVTLTNFDRVLFVGRHWDPNKERQGEGRIHRIGQKGDPAAEYLHCAGTSDDLMAEVHTLKENRFTSVTGSTDVRRLAQWASE